MFLPTEEYWPYFSRDYGSGGDGDRISYDICPCVEKDNLASPELLVTINSVNIRVIISQDRGMDGYTWLMTACIALVSSVLPSPFAPWAFTLTI